MKKYILPVFAGILFLAASCTQKSPEKDPVEINDQGIRLTNEGKHEEALQLFLQAIKKTNIPADTRGTILRNIALTYNQLNKKDSSLHFSTLAAKCYRKNSYDYLVNAADVDLLTGKTAAALKKLQKAVNLNPDEMAVNNTLGLLYMGEYGEAYTDLEKALGYNLKAFDIGKSRVIEEVLALNYYNLEKYKDAEKHYTHLHQNYPDMITYTLNMGLSKYKLKKKEEAEALFKEVISKDSTYKESIELFRNNN